MTESSIHRPLLPRWLTEPVLAHFLRSRALAATLLGVGAAQIALAMTGLPTWQCPLLKTTGIPCAGCGLTRSIREALRGHWGESLRLHAFGVISIAVLVLLLVAAIAPRRIRLGMATWVERLERHTALGMLLLIGLFVYWIARLMHYGPSDSRWMTGN